MAVLVVIGGGGAFVVVILLQQQASATTTTAVVDHNKCSVDVVTCTHNKETHHSAKDSTPFVLPIPFP